MFWGGNGLYTNGLIFIRNFANAKIMRMIENLLRSGKMLVVSIEKPVKRHNFTSISFVPFHFRSSKHLHLHVAHHNIVRVLR